MSFLILYNYFDFHVSQLNQVFQSQDGLLSDRKKRWVLTSRTRDVVLRGMQRYGPFSVIFRALFTKWLIFRHTLSHSPVIQNYCYIFLLYVYTHTHTHTYCYCCSVTQACPTLCDPMDCSMPDHPVLHHLLEFAQVQGKKKKNGQYFFASYFHLFIPFNQT